MHAPGYVKCKKKQEAGSRNRATMITMTKSGILSPHIKTQVSPVETAEEDRKKKKSRYADVQRASRISRRHVRKDNEDKWTAPKDP